MASLIRAKKSLGQNFLKSKQAAHSIIRAANITPGNIILEIGPGKGFLTKELLASVAHVGSGKVIAVEKDDALVPFLQELFAKEIATGMFQLIHADILPWKPEEHGLADHSYKLIANIPYYITGAIVRKFLGNAKSQPERMVLMLQKEVAERISARDGKESLLSLSVKAYGNPHYIEKVAAKYFSPEPNVDSAILLIENISREFFTDISEETFFNLIHLGFAHKRKQLVGNLAGENLPRETILKVFKEIGIPDKARAEDISLPQWKELAKHLQRYFGGKLNT